MLYVDSIAILLVIACFSRYVQNHNLAVQDVGTYRNRTDFHVDKFLSIRYNFWNNVAPKFWTITLHAQAN